MSSVLHIEHLGQITEAHLSLGDLTVFVGPQASGKSIALQMLKLMVDGGQVQEEMNRHGIDWEGNLPDFIDAYLGEGMHSVWREGETTIRWAGKSVDLGQIAKHKRKAKPENLFFIPAQRVLALRDGWPRPFSGYSPGDPFAVREFSEKLRVLVESEFRGESLFPKVGRLKKDFRDLLERDVFGRFSLRVDKVHSQKRLVLGEETSDQPLPYMVWSAGQREFVPLLLGLYWLMPAGGVSRRDQIEWVVIEELEMGLHPRAITVVLLLIFELLERGYRICLSTHSSQILDAVWALRHLRENRAPANALLDLFGAPRTPGMTKLAEATLTKSMKVHYFDRTSGKTRDITELDPGAEETGDSGWGGLTEFSGRATDAVARAVANAKR